MSDPVKHHFVPQFYLSAWCDADGKVLYFRRRNGLVVSRRISPKYTGYENRLYSLDRVPAEHQQMIEREFFSKEVDGKAGRIIPTLLEGRIGDLSKTDRIEWTRFLISLRIRTPDIVNKLKKDAADELRKNLSRDIYEYEAVRGGASEKSLVEWVENNFVGLIDSFGMLIFPEIIMDAKFTTDIANMQWWVEDVSETTVPLLTSDRPLWISTGLGEPNCLLALALSPTKVFFSCRNPEMRAALIHNGRNRLVRRCNESLASQAVQYIYGHAQPSFIERLLRC